MVFNIVTAVAIVTYWYAYNNLPSQEINVSSSSTAESIVPEAIAINKNNNISNDIGEELSDKPKPSLDKETQFIKFMINFAKDYYDKNTEKF